MKRYNMKFEVGTLSFDKGDRQAALASMVECEDGEYIKHLPIHEAAPKMYAEIERDIEWLERKAKKYVVGSYELQGIQSRKEKSRCAGYGGSLNVIHDK